MIEKIIKFVKELGEEYKPWMDDQVIVRKMDKEFNITVNGITIYFDNSKTWGTYTLIEIYQYKDYASIAFRTHQDVHQTSYITFDIDECKDIEWEIDGEYKYIEE